MKSQTLLPTNLPPFSQNTSILYIWYFTRCVREIHKWRLLQTFFSRRIVFRYTLFLLPASKILTCLLITQDTIRLKTPSQRCLPRREPADNFNLFFFLSSGRDRTVNYLITLFARLRTNNLLSRPVYLPGFTALLARLLQHHRVNNFYPTPP